MKLGSFPRLRPAAFGVAAVALIAAMPSLTGVIILQDLVSGKASALTDPVDAMRRAAYPASLWLHILGGSGFVLLGLLQFSATLRRHLPWLHRWSGRVLVAGGLGMALAAFWMNYIHPNRNDSGLHDALQTIASMALIATLGLGIAAIRRRQITAHRAWMMRAYALCLGAGTQTLFLLPLFLSGHMPAVPVQDFVFGMAWVVNLAIAEALIRRQPPVARTIQPMDAAAG